jgi:hypothetical protein
MLNPLCFKNGSIKNIFQKNVEPLPNSLFWSQPFSVIFLLIS